LGEEDFRRLDKMFQWLKYDCIGEYIYYEAIEWVDVLHRHSNYQKTTYYKKYNDFITPTIPRFRIYRWFIMEHHFPRLLFDLRKGLIEELFRLESDFETLVNLYNDFRFFISSAGSKATEYQNFLILGEALLEKKRQEINRREYVPEDNTYDTNLSPEEPKLGLTDHFVVPFATQKPDILLDLKILLERLEEVGLISSSSEFINPFITPGNEIHSKVIWNGELKSLVFFLEYLMFLEILHRPRYIAKQISLFFSTSKQESLNPKTINNYSENMGFTDKDYDTKKFKIHQFIENNNNSEIGKTYQSILTFF